MRSRVVHQAMVTVVLVLACGVIAAASAPRCGSDASMWPAAAERTTGRKSAPKRTRARIADPRQNCHGLVEDWPRTPRGLLRPLPFRLILRGGQVDGKPFGWEQGEGCDVEDWKRLAEQVHAALALCILPEGAGKKRNAKARYSSEPLAGVGDRGSGSAPKGATGVMLTPRRRAGAGSRRRARRRGRA